MNKYYQVRDSDGNELGLFATDRNDKNVETDIEECFKAMYKLCDEDPNIDFYDTVERELENKRISRIFVEEVYVNI